VNGILEVVSVYLWLYQHLGLFTPIYKVINKRLKKRKCFDYTIHKLYACEPGFTVSR
jgi:hypothetical protein